MARTTQGRGPVRQPRTMGSWGAGQPGCLRRDNWPADCGPQMGEEGARRLPIANCGPITDESLELAEAGRLFFETRSGNSRPRRGREASCPVGPIVPMIPRLPATGPAGKHPAGAEKTLLSGPPAVLEDVRGRRSGSGEPVGTLAGSSAVKRVPKNSGGLLGDRSTGLGGPRREAR